MDKTEALRSIQYDLFEYIQKEVTVEVDSNGLPIGFRRGRERHSITRVLDYFRTQPGWPINAFLIEDDYEEVYFLYFHFLASHPDNRLNEGSWVLSFRILSDRELMALYRRDRKMLLNMAIEKVVDFHGHLCPELVIGVRVSEYAHRYLPGKDFSLIAENTTSAVDAIQVLLGTTLGNKRLQVMDFGKHNYTFVLPGDRHMALRLSLKRPHYGDEDRYQGLWEKIRGLEATFDDVLEYQRLMDMRIKALFKWDLEDMFDLEELRYETASAELPSLYKICHICHREVLIDRAIEYHGNLYCIPCFQRINNLYRLQDSWSSIP